MQRFSSFRDLTARQSDVQPTAAPLLLAIKCNHKTTRAGAKFRGKLVLWCAACVKEKARG